MIMPLTAYELHLRRVPAILNCHREFRGGEREGGWVGRREENFRVSRKGETCPNTFPCAEAVEITYGGLMRAGKFSRSAKHGAGAGGGKGREEPGVRERV